MPMVSTSGASRSREPVFPGAPGNSIGPSPADADSGNAVVALTPVTPGIAASARSTRSWNPIRSGGFGKNSGGLRTRKVRRPSGLKPGSARSRCSTLRTTSPPLLRSTSESATCATIMLRRMRPWPPPPRTALLASSDDNVARAAQTAGTAAASSPSTMPSPAIPTPICQSTAIDSRRGRSSGASAMSAPVAQTAASAPNAPPTRPRRPPSTSVARMTARSLAPRARDTANSCSRCAARASSTDARLTISMSASSAPAAPSTTRAGRALKTTSSLSLMGKSFRPRLLKSRASIVRPAVSTAAATASGELPRRARSKAE